MPPTNVYFFRESTGDAPVLDWLRNLRRRDSRAYAKCAAAIHELAARGHELRRPLADYIVAGIHELRVRVRRQNYRVLYFFHGRDVAILVHGLTKEDRLPRRDIERALQRKRTFEGSPDLHTYEEELDA